MSALLSLPSTRSKSFCAEDYALGPDAQSPEGQEVDSVSTPWKERQLTSAERVGIRITEVILTLNDSVDVDPQVRGGVPVVKGTRIPLARILAEVRDGETLEEIADDLGIEMTLLVTLFDALASHLGTVHQ